AFSPFRLAERFASGPKAPINFDGKGSVLTGSAASQAFKTGETVWGFSVAGPATPRAINPGPGAPANALRMAGVVAPRLGSSLVTERVSGFFSAACMAPAD